MQVFQSNFYKMNSAIGQNLEDLSDPDRGPATNPQQILELNQMITSSKTLKNPRGRNRLHDFSKKGKRSNSYQSTKTLASTLTVISKHSIPPDLQKIREPSISLSGAETIGLRKEVADFSKLPKWKTQQKRKIEPKSQLESVLEVR